MSAMTHGLSLSLFVMFSQSRAQCLSCPSPSVFATLSVLTCSSMDENNKLELFLGVEWGGPNSVVNSKMK